MSLIIHHNDDDGRCAAAIIYNEFCMEEPMTEKNFIEYNYNGKPDVDLDMLHPYDTVYILDISINASGAIFSLMQDIIAKDDTIHIVHIDHHLTTQQFLENMTPEQESFMKKYVRSFVKIGISGSMLCWIYQSMTDEQRSHCHDVEFDFTDARSHIGIAENGKAVTDTIPYRVPLVIRFIDDYDVWRHEIAATMAFHYGFSLEADKHPMNKMWSDLLYNQSHYEITKQYVEPGQYILRYNKNRFAQLMKYSHVSEICGIKCLCVNTADRSSQVFGQLIKEYPAVCAYSYDGERHMWKYSFYSDEGSDVDVSKICETFGGGGHKHAAGMSEKYLIV